MCFRNFPDWVLTKSIFKTGKGPVLPGYTKKDYMHPVYRDTKAGLILAVQVGSTLCRSYYSVLCKHRWLYRPFDKAHLKRAKLKLSDKKPWQTKTEPFKLSHKSLYSLDIYLSKKWWIVRGITVNVNLIVEYVIWIWKIKLNSKYILQNIY